MKQTQMEGRTLETHIGGLELIKVKRGKYEASCSPTNFEHYYKASDYRADDDQNWTNCRPGDESCSPGHCKICPPV